MGVCRWTWWLAAGIAFGPFEIARGQEAVVIVDEPACARCRIVLREAGTLGLRDGDIPSRPWFARQDTRGRIYVIAPEIAPSLPLVFRTDGRYVGELGREGAGPGEFRSAMFIVVGPGDTLYVFDAGQARLSVLDHEWTLIRTAPIPRSISSAEVLENGAIVVNADVQDRDRIGEPFHRFDAHGTYLGAFGSAAVGPVLPGDYAGRNRWLAAAGGSRFWSLTVRREYTIELWDADSGRLLRRFARNPEWFERYSEDRPTTRDRAPQAEGVAIWSDRATGWIWTVVNTADQHWRSGLGPPVRLEGQVAYRIVDRQRVFDSVVEVIDPLRGRVIARARWDQTIDMVLAGGLVAGARARPDGTPYLQLWRIEVVDH